jgi:glycosyltransferase involved in cell wall biosynthesis
MSVPHAAEVPQAGELLLEHRRQNGARDVAASLEPVARVNPKGFPAEVAQGRSTVSLIIPAKNEARNLPNVLDHLPSCIDEVILVDGRSSDVTKVIAATCRPDIRIISEPGPGKGLALRAGFAAARGDFVIAMDADGSMSPAEIPQFIYFLEHGFDFVKGSRFIGGGGSLDITTIRRIGDRALLYAANFIYRAKITDINYGFYAFKRQYLDHLDLRSSGFEIEAELMIRALKAGLRIAEVPSLEMPRRAGRSNLHAFQDGQRVLRTLLTERKRPTSLPQPSRANGLS